MKDKLLLIVVALLFFLVTGAVVFYFKGNVPSLPADVKTTHVDAYQRANGTHVKGYDRR